MARIGIMGGTFDPIHYAHLTMAKRAMEFASLEKVYFMPSKNPPHKQERKVLSEEKRASMVKLAIEDCPGFLFSDFELKQEGMTYTAHTLRKLQERNPKDQFYFILGGDSLFVFETWYRPEEIAKRAVILAVSRDGVSTEKMQERAKWLAQKYAGVFQIVPMEKINISSSMIREKCAKKEPIGEYVPPKVRDYILAMHCYDKR